MASAASSRNSTPRIDGDVVGGYLLRKRGASPARAARVSSCKITRAAAEPVKTPVQHKVRGAGTLLEGAMGTCAMRHRVT